MYVLLTLLHQDSMYRYVCFVIVQAHHRNECSKYPVMCELCDSDVPRQDVSVSVNLLYCMNLTVCRWRNTS